MNDPITPGLSRRLREGTWAQHGLTERAGIMPALLRGQLPCADYCVLLRNLHLLYATLEPALARAASGPQGTAWRGFIDPALSRTAALADDLATLHGAQWAAQLAPAAAAQHYAERLASLAEHQPLALAAHAYVRYLGDLSGGQAVARVVRRAYRPSSASTTVVNDTAGTRFYDFGSPQQTTALAGQLRQAIDALPLADEAQADTLVAEAQWAFAQHARLFEELAAGTAPVA